MRRFLGLRNGIPGHDTIRRVFEALSPAELEQRQRHQRIGRVTGWLRVSAMKAEWRAASVDRSEESEVMGRASTLDAAQGIGGGG